MIIAVQTYATEETVLVGAQAVDDRFMNTKKGTKDKCGGWAMESV